MNSVTWSSDVLTHVKLVQKDTNWVIWSVYCTRTAGGSFECVELTAGWLDPILEIGNGPILVKILGSII